MRIALLGPLRLTEGGQAIAVSGPRQRAVLAFLALHPNQVVAAERLIDELWGEPAPSGAGNALQAAVSRLRKSLPAGRLVTTPQGYLLQITPDELDVAEFEQAVALGRQALAGGAAAEAAVQLRTALALWRGPALADFRFDPFAQAEIARLEEAQLACREARVDADLALGAGAELVAQLQQLVADHPLREKLTEQLMLALYRSGRQAEALEAFRRTRDLLREELGIEPSPVLVRCQAAILRQEPLDEPAAPGRSPDDGPLGAPAAPPPAGMPAGGSAGGAAASSVASSTRRPVSVVCLDVAVPAVAVAVATALDPEMLHLVGERLRGLVGPVLERHGGRLLPGTGRTLFGAFGAVALHEDDARRAAAAALECREAVLAARDLGVACRIAVVTAEALVPAGDPLGFIGEGRALAHGLAEAAAPGEVLLSEATFGLAAAALDVEPLVPGRPPGHRLRGVRVGARSLPVRLEAPVLGRRQEIARLEEACAQAVRERTTVFVTVVGDAGIGKTRLVHELVQRLGESATVITGCCPPYGEGITFWPLRQLVQQVTGGDRGAAAIAAAMRGDPDAEVVADRLTRAFGAGEAGGADTAEIFWATRRLFEALGRRRLLVVVLEDVHWAEPTFLGLVESVALQPGNVPVVVLCLTRPELLQDRPDWLSGAREHAVVQLQPLSDQVAAALTAELSRPVELSEAARVRLVQAAGGNPLYLEQLLAAVDEQPRTAAGDLPMPPTIQALLASRLDRLGPAEHEVLAAASVIGKDFATGAVAALLPRRIGERLSWHLRTLTTKALVHPLNVPGAPAPGGQVAGADHTFRHILVQEATYRAIPKSARARLHERLANWAETQTGHDSPQRIERLGHHLAQATVYYRELAQFEPADSLAGRATEYLVQAGTTALAVGDATAAVRALERAVTLLPSGDARRPTVLTALAAAHLESGTLAQARAAVDEALRIAVERDAARERAYAMIQSLQLDLHTDPHGAVDRVERGLADVRSVFAGSGDEQGLCQVWMLEASVHWHRARCAAAEHAWQQAMVAARAVGDHRHLTRSIWWLASAALWGPTPAREGIARCRRYLAEIGSSPTGRAVIQLHQAGLHAMVDEVGTARQLRASGAAILREVGSGLPIVVAEPAAFIALLVEDYASAERYLRTAFDALRAMGEQADLATCAALLARVLALQGSGVPGGAGPGEGRWDEVARYLRISSTSAGGQDLTARIVGGGALARALAVRGELGAAVRGAREAVDLAAGTDLLNPHGDALVDLAWVLAAAGRRAEAAGAVRAARSRYQQKENWLGVRTCDRFLATAE
ncbi:MAG TPA: BTAD domain-containing putative transcriptional regulator [Kineosporiaceae bacterium]